MLDKICQLNKHTAECLKETYKLKNAPVYYTPLNQPKFKKLIKLHKNL